MHILSILFLGLQVILLPILSFQTRAVIEDEDIDELPSKNLLYRQSIIMLSVIGLLAFAVNWKENLKVEWWAAITPKVILISVLIYILGIAINLIHLKYFSKEKEEKDDFVMPDNKSEYMLWFLLCITAAWSEELVYRGVLTGLMTKFGMIGYLAAILSAVCFSFSHAAQGWIAIPVTFIFALGFQYLYHISGALFLPILVHFFYNISIEWIKRRLDKNSSSTGIKPD